MKFEFDLNQTPWSYLLRFIDNPDLKVRKFLLGLKFKYSILDNMGDINLCRYIKINDTKYLPFTAYISGLICRYEGDYSIPKFIICNGDTYLPETFKKEFDKGSNNKPWGHKCIDQMLKFIRKKKTV